MANRNFVSQFQFSFEKQMVNLCGVFTKTAQRAKASLTNQGITYTAVNYGAAGNSITIALLDPGAINQALSVTVSGNAISVHLATDAGGLITSTATDVVAAITGSAPASALIVATGSGLTALTALTATHLSGGLDTAFSSNLPISGIMSISQTAVGTYTITLTDKYYDLLSAQIMIQSSSAVNLVPQLVSSDVVSAKTIVFELLDMHTATPSATDLANSAALLIDLKLRNVK